MSENPILYSHSRDPPLTQGLNMRSCVGEQWRLPLQGLTKHSGTIVYWGFFLRFNYFRLVPELRESQICLGSSKDYLVLLLLVLLGNFRLDILPIIPDPTFDCTLPEADYKLVTLVTIILLAHEQTQGSTLKSAPKKP
jgi:hypothetical protein